MNKRGFEFSFSWIFALIVGAAVLFLSIYLANQIIGTKEFEEQSVSGKRLGILLNPIETSLESAKYVKITVPEETRIYNECKDIGQFGRQDISASSKSKTKKEWSSIPGATSSFNNKYLFSESNSEAEENFFILSKPFAYPFKIADILIMWGDKEEFCFINSPEDIKKELNDSLKINNVYFTKNPNDCKEYSKKICFPPKRDECDIEVSFNTQSVKFNSEDKTVYFPDFLDSNDKYTLVYASIFSSPEIYECQIKRLMSRMSELSKLYLDKSGYLQNKGCGSATLISDLQNIISLSDSASNQGSIATKTPSFSDKAKQLEEKNEGLICKLF